MHGTTMIFLVIMPLSAGLANYLLPLMIGARDVAFPRLNAFGFWVFLVGGLFMYSSFFLGGAPNGGWFGYAPLTRNMPGHNIDYWVFGLQILGIASLTGAINLIVTVINMRAPGMSLMRMPIFVWMSLVAQFLLLFAIPVITVALFLLSFDRLFATNFFNADAGADPLLWQHLFWLFGHPEVYILILPAMGIVSGDPARVLPEAPVRLPGHGVLRHRHRLHGLGRVGPPHVRHRPRARSPCPPSAPSTMFIAVPTGVKIFNWISTLWRGKITLTTPLLFAVGFVAMFTIGGLSGVTHAVVPVRHPADRHLLHRRPLPLRALRRQHLRPVRRRSTTGTRSSPAGMLSRAARQAPLLADADRVQPHLRPVPHPRPPGHAPADLHLPDGPGLGRLEPRGHHRARSASPCRCWSSSYNLWVSRKSPQVGDDPWDARTLEWTIPSPPPEYNFKEIPLVTARDDFWHRKYTEDEDGRAVLRDRGRCRPTARRSRTEDEDDEMAEVDANPQTPTQAADAADGRGRSTPTVVEADGGDGAERPTPTASHDGDGDDGDDDRGDGEHEEHVHIHMPSPSYWPAFTAVGLAVISYGMIYKAWVVAILGGVWLLGGIYAWSLEPATAPDEPEEPDGNGAALEPGRRAVRQTSSR